MKYLMRARGFTIVELLVVVVIIAILATLATVAYRGVSDMAQRSAITNELSQYSTKLKTYRINNNEQFPVQLGDLGLMDTQSQFTLRYTANTERTAFCLEARKASLSYFVTENSDAQEGQCDGFIGVPGVDNGTSEVVYNAAYAVDGDMHSLRVAMNETWTEVAVSWDAIMGATRYEVQVDRGDGTWVYVNKTTGDSRDSSYACANAATRANCSAQIAAGVTSLVWSNAHARPVSTETTFSYRVAAIVDGARTEWGTAILAPQVEGRTAVKNPSIRPIQVDDINSYELSWPSVLNNNVPSPTIQIQVDRGDGTWVYVNKTTGAYTDSSYSCANLPARAGCSGQIAVGTTSLVWNNVYSRPVDVVTEYNYRIRLASNVVSGVNSEWTEFAFSLPGINAPSTPAAFSVTPGAGWANITFAWEDATLPLNILNPTTQIQVDRGNGTWIYVNKATGTNADSGYSCANLPARAGCSGQIAVGTDSISWSNTYSVPSVGTTYRYRIRYYSNTISGLDSPWTTTSLSRP